jgi:pilus assembly protein Flp/PilA
VLKTYIAAKIQLANFKDHLEGLKDRFQNDQDGAALIEYSILIGLISAVAVGTVVTVGTWVSGKWTTLNTALQAA